MTNWFFRYRITYWNDYEEHNQQVSGFLEAATYVEAMEKLTDFYGEDDLISVDTLYSTDFDCGVLEDEGIDDVRGAEEEKENF